MTSHDAALGALAVERGLLTREALRAAVEQLAARPGATLPQLLVDGGHLTRAQAEALQSSAPSGGFSAGDPLFDRLARRGVSPAQLQLWTGAPSSGRFARYRDVTEIGRGGMGAILRAIDPDTRRPVAIKVLRMGATASAQEIERFVVEAQVTAQLEHPNIIPLHELGMTPDGELYFSMKLVRGSDLDATLAAERSEGGWGLERLLGVLVKVCDALAFAHSHQIVHRDLKPANIMVGAFGEVLVMDWGLARLPGQREAPGSVMGTPAYMPPEQARGELHRVDGRSDVYALGALLYQMLTLTPPYEGISAQAVMDAVKAGRLEPPSRRAPGRSIPRALEAIVLRAMQPEPADRYADPTALRDDLEAYLADRPVSVAPDTLRERVARSVRRHPTRALAAALLLLFAAFGGVGGGVLVARRADALRREGEARAARRAAELRLLAREGKIHALVGELSGERRQLRDTWLDAFLVRWSAARAAGQSDVQFLREAGPAHVTRVEATLDALIAARILYGRGIRVTPDDYTWRGNLRNARGDHDGAIRDHDAALALDPTFIDARYNRGNARLDKGALAAAIADFDRVLAQQADHAGALNNRGAARRRQGDFAGALADLDRVVGLRPRSARAHYNRGLIHRRAGQARKALADLDRALALQPGYLHALRERGRLRLAAGDVRGALQDLDRAVRQAPDDAELRNNRGVARQRTGDLAGALKDFDHALAMRPDYPEALHGRGLVRAARGDRAGALADYGQALRLRPAFAEALVNRGKLRRSAGDGAGARADYDEALRFQPDLPEAWCNRGNLRVAQGDLVGAFDDFGRALQLRPGYATAFIGRGGVRFRRGELRAALADLDRGLTLRPDDAVGLTSRASVHLTLGNRPDALADYDRALKLEPDLFAARYNRGTLRQARGDLVGALADYDHALRLRPGHAKSRLRRGDARLTRGDLGGALADFDAVLARNPRDWRAWGPRALALARSGRRREAAEAFERALQLCPPAQRDNIAAARDQALGPR